MYIKIYFNSKPLFLCDQIDEIIEPFIHHDDAVLIDELDPHTIKSMIHEMQQENVHAGVFIHPDLGELKKAFFKKFRLVKAAGGLVVNEQQEVLLIHRRGKWDLPKGKLDPGETLEQCAVREVEEETGLKKVTLTAPLIVTYHTYHEGTHFILKESHWYTMSADSHQDLVPQAEEDIHQIKWVKKDAIRPYKDDSFPSVIDVLEAGLTK
ncbi:MAG TPA: NUDIX hydrolase [Chitinophagaceae bacterium]|nr:NUDIX hydrolase [Chitinophagaceae bacterium]